MDALETAYIEAKIDRWFHNPDNELADHFTEDSHRIKPSGRFVTLYCNLGFTYGDERFSAGDRVKFRLFDMAIVGLA